MKKRVPSDFLNQMDAELDAHRPAADAVIREHRESIGQWWDRYEAQRKPRFATEAYELARGVWIEILEGMQVAFGGSPQPAAAGPTRGAAAQASRRDPSAPRSELILLHPGENCVGRLKIGWLSGGKVRLEVSLLRDAIKQKPFRHFHITVTGVSGERLLDHKEIQEGVCLVPGVDLAEYRFVLETASGK